MKPFDEHGTRPTLRFIAFMALLFSLLSSNHISNNFHLVKTVIETSPLNQGPYRFVLSKPEPIHFQVDYMMENLEDKKNSIILVINDQWKKVIRTQTTNYYQRIRFTIPQTRFLAGQNKLAIRFESGIYPVVRLKVQLKNYLGISANFPQAYIVDEARLDDSSGMGKMLAVAKTILEVFLFSFMLFAGFFKIARFILPSFLWENRNKAVLLLIVPILIPLTVIFYSYATPVNVIFPSLSLFGICFIYFLFAVVILFAVRWKKVVYPAAIIIFVTLGLGEISMRLYNYFNPSHIFYNKSYNRYRGKQVYYNGFRLNSKAFHDIEYPLEKPKNAFRIVALGDSFAYGIVPYQFNYLTLLEDKLKQDRPATEVINMGISGTGVQSYLSVLLNEGINYNPDMVIVGFFIGNDFEVPRKRPYENSFLATFFHYTYRLIGYYIYQIKQAEKSVSSSPDEEKNPMLATPVSSYDDERPSFDPTYFMTIEVSRSIIFRKDNAKFLEEAERAFYYLREMRDVCQKRGIKFAVTIIPDEVQVNSALQQKVIRAHGIEPDGMDFFGPNQWLGKRLSEANIPVMDLTQYFMEHSNDNRLYRLRDTHWNIAGNQLAADILYQELFDLRTPGKITFR